MIEIIPNWHPLFVHFTVALFLIAAALQLAAQFVAKESLANQLGVVARWNLWIGVALTVLTVAAGIYAYNTVKHDGPSHIVMTVHRNLAFATFVVFVVLALWSGSPLRERVVKNWLFTGVLIAAAGLLATTAWYGGELVYRHGLGVMALPKPEPHSHGHDDESMNTHHDDFADAPSSGGEVESHTHAPGEEPHQH